MERYIEFVIYYVSGQENVFTCYTDLQWISIKLFFLKLIYKS